MQFAEKKTVSNNEAVIIKAKARPSKFNAQFSLEVLEQLRKDGAEFYKTHYLAGRNAMIDLMGKVYEQFHAAKKSKDYERFIQGIKKALTDAGKTIKSSSSDTSLLTRYIFEEFDDKQISIYGRSLLVAYEKNIAPEEFPEFVKNTKGGFWGLVKKEGTSSEADKTNSDTISSDTVTAIEAIRKSETAGEIPDFKWEGAEDYTFLIAFRDIDGDKAEMKKLPISAKTINRLMSYYKKDKKGEEKLPEDEQAQAMQIALQDSKLESHNLTIQIADLERDKDAAMKDGEKDKVRKTQAKIIILSSQLEGVKKFIKNSGKTVETATA